MDGQKRHWFSEEVSTADLQHVQDVALDRHGFFATVLKFGDLRVQTAAEVTDFLLRGIPKPQEVLAVLDRTRDATRRESPPTLLPAFDLPSRHAPATMNRVASISGVGMSIRGPSPKFERAPVRTRSRVSYAARPSPVRHLRWILPLAALLGAALFVFMATTRVRGPSTAAASGDEIRAAGVQGTRPTKKLLAARGPAPRLEPASAGALPVIPARAYVLIDEASGAILAESGGTRRLPPASVTKIATAILLLELGHLDDTITIDADFSTLAPDSSSMGLSVGDRYSFRDLLYGLMLRSGNDAALAIAQAVSGDEARFVNTMNALAARLDLPDTHFTDPHGLGGPQHYTSARDLASLTRYGFTLPGFAEVVRTTQWDTHGSERTELWNSNVFLYMYDGADGVKIGYTEEADRTLVASATRDGRRLIAVVLGDSYAATHASQLLDWGWASTCWPTPGGICERVKPRG